LKIAVQANFLFFSRSFFQNKFCDNPGAGTSYLYHVGFWSTKTSFPPDSNKQNNPGAGISYSPSPTSLKNKVFYQHSGKIGFCGVLSRMYRPVEHGMKTGRVLPLNPVLNILFSGI
jgi:hypothetical protein